MEDIVEGYDLQKMPQKKQVLTVLISSTYWAHMAADITKNNEEKTFSLTLNCSHSS